ncbi:HAD family hydrolase [uncultured Selenomonas sp.]|uniref:KdsC family phosphatase n=1 Tax=uncultured Selenomonas sp. TaxID=159275 RepID=UPI0026081E14|nr:HAD-IIIA family hydrolase [uncultured Selenomonas sp.]
MIYSADAMERARRVRFIIFDVDGVLTDGGIYTGESGELLKPFHVRDGLGICQWQNEGLGTAIITGRDSAIVSRRAAELKIQDVYLGYADKRSAYADIKERHALRDEEIAYVGDDLIDLAVMAQVGFPAAPADAAAEVQRLACLVSGKPGGKGAVREIIEFVLKAQGRWENVVARFMTPAQVADVSQ